MSGTDANVDAPTAAPQPSSLVRVFLSLDERRLRTGWRLLLQFLLFVVLSILANGLYALIVRVALRPPQLAREDVGAILLLFKSLLQLLALTVSVYVARRFLDRRSLTSLGLAWNGMSWRDLLAGVVVAAAMMGLIVLVEWSLGWLRFEGFAWQVQPHPPVLLAMLFFLAIFVFIAWREELLVRGYQLQNLTEGLNLNLSVLLSSLIFALLHLNNPSFSPAAFLGLVAAGLFFAYAYVRTRQLWLPMGLHLGWNFFEAPVFGLPVSGLRTFSLLQQTTLGPAFLTGGDFGPEAGLILLPALALGVLLVDLYARESRKRGVETETNGGATAAAAEPQT